MRRSAKGVGVVPVRPEDRRRYPVGWDRISRSVKERAGWRCGCQGECGRGTHSGRCPNEHGGAVYGTGARVVLTSAHLDHSPENCELSNLKGFLSGVLLAL